jgi:hypothetical protein
MAAQPKIFSFFKMLGGVTTRTTRNTSMRRTLSGCYVFWHIRRLIVVDLYAVCARKTSGRSFYFVENGEAAFLQAAQAIAWQLGVGGERQDVGVGWGRQGAYSGTMIDQTSFKRLILRATLRHVSPMVIRLVSVSDQVDLPEFNHISLWYTQCRGLHHRPSSG